MVTLGCTAPSLLKFISVEILTAMASFSLGTAIKCLCSVQNSQSLFRITNILRSRIFNSLDWHKHGNQHGFNSPRHSALIFGLFPRKSHQQPTMAAIPTPFFHIQLLLRAVDDSTMGGRGQASVWTRHWAAMRCDGA